MGASPSKPGGGEHVQGTPVKIPPGEAVAESISTAFPSFANTWTVALAVLIADRPAAAGITATAAVLPFKNDNKYVKHGSVSIKARRRRTRLRYSCKNTAGGGGGRVNFDGLPFFRQNLDRGLGSFDSRLAGRSGI